MVSFYFKLFSFFFFSTSRENFARCDCIYRSFSATGEITNVSRIICLKCFSFEGFNFYVRTIKKLFYGKRATQFIPEKKKRKKR